MNYQRQLFGKMDHPDEARGVPLLSGVTLLTACAILW
jgi:hypothetical protein